MVRRAEIDYIILCAKEVLNEGLGNCDKMDLYLLAVKGERLKRAECLVNIIKPLVFRLDKYSREKHKRILTNSLTRCKENDCFYKGDEFCIKILNLAEKYVEDVR